ncbi:uncharacterized protein F5147DRAFT_690022 [Suillus discolor]|uniref:Uncharacterized protein n=1 Tax=Suillus discolor TaxID=1912936 RepID=A0A9P7F856_9AGAM|nr:uncharacterized protein F5147DRAFT_690022 [Suillus discolor]KAG2110298.1 hypothetical protein F5147DRAFT_690022 [Suillus discolor]
MDAILLYLAVGVAVMSNAYGHFSDRPTKMWISLFTTVCTCIDDTVTSEKRSRACVPFQRAVREMRAAGASGYECA